MRRIALGVLLGVLIGSAGSTAQERHVGNLHQQIHWAESWCDAHEWEYARVEGLDVPCGHLGSFEDGVLIGEQAVLADDLDDLTRTLKRRVKP